MSALQSSCRGRNRGNQSSVLGRDQPKGSNIKNEYDRYTDFCIACFFAYHICTRVGSLSDRAAFPRKGTRICHRHGTAAFCAPKGRNKILNPRHTHGRILQHGGRGRGERRQRLVFRKAVVRKICDSCRGCDNEHYSRLFDMYAFCRALLQKRGNTDNYSRKGHGLLTAL